VLQTQPCAVQTGAGVGVGPDGTAVGAAGAAVGCPGAAVCCAGTAVGAAGVAQVLGNPWGAAA
jgi:hypothetical protein